MLIGVAPPLSLSKAENERESGELTLKDLILGSEMSKNIEDNKAWREDQPAQVSVPRSSLVASVRSILDRYASE